MIGLRIDAEVHTNQGRIDAVIELPNRIILFEFKLNKSADIALQQIKDNGYAEKYQLGGKPITLISAKFDTPKRKITEWKQEQAQ